MDGRYYRSVSGRCGNCKKYLGKECPGMHGEFYWRDCPIYQKDLRRGYKNGRNDVKKGAKESRSGEAHK